MNKCDERMGGCEGSMVSMSEGIVRVGEEEGILLKKLRGLVDKERCKRRRREDVTKTRQ